VKRLRIKIQKLCKSPKESDKTDVPHALPQLQPRSGEIH
jgi:hypothetical protein